MSKNKFFSGKVVLILAVLVLAFLLFKDLKHKEKPENLAPVVSSETALLVDAAVWYPSAPWSEPKITSEQTPYGNLSGENIQATVTSKKAYLDHFEMISELERKGFKLDNNLAADGPGSSQWGYKNESKGKSQVLIFSYQTEPTSKNPNGPLQFNCPCKINTKVFISYPFTSEKNN